MVDLVKIRQKAKEKKEKAAETPAVAESPAETAEAATNKRGTPAAGRPAPKENRPEAAVLPRHEAPAQSKLERFKETAGRREEIRRDESAVAVAEEESRLQLLTFVIAGEQYAIEIENIVEIVSPRPTTRVPNAASTIVGIISLRGTIVTILDIRRMLGHPPTEGDGPETRIIVVEREGEIGGFVVDKVWRKISIDRAEVESHPVVSASEQSESIRGVFQQGTTLSILLDLERLFRR